MLSSSNPSVSSILMCQEIERPLDFTRAVLKVDRVVQVTSEEVPKSIYNCKGVGLF